jgi:CDP-diglyceride synthetase
MPSKKVVATVTTFLESLFKRAIGYKDKQEFQRLSKS